MILNDAKSRTFGPSEQCPRCPVYNGAVQTIAFASHEDIDHHSSREVGLSSYI